MSENYQPVIEYIENYWDKAVEAKGDARNLVMRVGQVGLPNKFVAPNHAYFAGTQFYWDTYFTVLGLVEAERLELAKGMVDNLCFLFGKFGLLPARNSWTSLGRTQPPFLTRMAFEVFEAGGADRKWLNKVIAVAKKEYKNVWMSNQRFDKSTGLSQYKPKFWKGKLTVYESGWDDSSRYQAKGQQLLPIDLNCQLYVYEQDFAKHAKLSNKKSEQEKWEKLASERAKKINQYFWDEKTGFYYDLDLETKSRQSLKTLAGFFPLWCGIANKKQAQKIKTNLKFFEGPGGLTNTEKIKWTGKQWDYPNGWPPHQLIVCEGFKRYGFGSDAERLAQKWLDLNTQIFNETGEFWEKYDVINSKIGNPGSYPTQSGFAWTNAVFLKLKQTDRLK